MIACLSLAVTGVRAADETSITTCEKDTGYRGIWYSNQPSNDEYKFKYSGGFATYPQQHIPIAYYSPEAEKTFFCYGGRPKENNILLHMVSYYDHKTGMVPRPSILLNKKTDDAHDNPALMIDDDGYIWIFSNAHGTGRSSFISRSTEPYSIDAFERVLTTNFSYSQPWFVPEKGFLFLHTRYRAGRGLWWMTSRNGRNWDEAQSLAMIAQGHYQVSWRGHDRIGTALNYHPQPGGLNFRTNLFYCQTKDFGKTWQTAAGEKLNMPLDTTATAALVHEYEKEGLLVYLKDLNFDAAGNPVILYLTSKGYESGPKNDPRQWWTAHWTAGQWRIKPFTRSDSNYDFGSLYIEDEGTWRIIAPTGIGPQPYNPGGEVEMWISRDEGATWQKTKQLTKNSPFNHTYVRRPVNAHPDFYALWADGNAREPSDSALYFTNRDGTNVWRLPTTMEGGFQKPEVVSQEQK